MPGVRRWRWRPRRARPSASTWIWLVRSPPSCWPKGPFLPRNAPCWGLGPPTAPTPTVLTLPVGCWRAHQPASSRPAASGLSASGLTGRPRAFVLRAFAPGEGAGAAVADIVTPAGETLQAMVARQGDVVMALALR